MISIIKNLINNRFNWRGHFWQGRFFSSPLDDSYMWTAIRYVERNPYRAQIVEKPWDYKWSSARHHMMIDNSSLVKDSLLRGLTGNWKDFLNTASGDDDVRVLELHERTGRPLGGNSFIGKLETLLNINLQKKKAGRKKKEK